MIIKLNFNGITQSRFTKKIIREIPKGRQITGEEGHPKSFQGGKGGGVQYFLARNCSHLFYSRLLEAFLKGLVICDAFIFFLSVEFYIFQFYDV